jgi:glycosyltransferase involved in cell wall biosynthesis
MVSKKVLILSNICAGGVETFSIYLAKKLKSIGFDMYFINQDEIKKEDSRFSSSLEKILISSNIPIISIEESYQANFFQIDTTFIIPFYATLYLHNYYSKIKDSNILPVLIGHIHNDGAYYYDNALLYSAITNKFICVSDTVTQKIQTLIPEKNKIHSKKCPLLINSVGSLTKTKNPIQLLFVGRISNESKGVYKLVEIAKYLEDSNVSFSLNIIGNGPDLPELKSQFTKEELKSDISFVTDADTPDKVAHFYANSDVLLILSSYEGGPLVLYEGMEFGTVPVSFNVGTVSSVIEHGKNGFVFSHTDFAKLKVQVKDLAEKKSLAVLKKNAQKRIRDLNIDLDSYGTFMSDIITKPLKNYADVSIRKTNSKINWKETDFRTWVLKILTETDCKRNYIFHYLNHHKKVEVKKQQEHYNSVYEDLPNWWKKIGTILRNSKK